MNSLVVVNISRVSLVGMNLVGLPREKENHHAPKIIPVAASKSRVFVHQIRVRGMGCASKFEKVPELNSRPNESSAIIITTAGQNKNGKKKRLVRMTGGEAPSAGISQNEKASSSAMTKLGSNSRISLRR